MIFEGLSQWFWMVTITVIRGRLKKVVSVVLDGYDNCDKRSFKKQRLSQWFWMAIMIIVTNVNSERLPSLCGYIVFP
jgi:hypothetical protein